MPGIDLIALLIYVGILRGLSLYDWRVWPAALAVAVLPVLIHGLIYSVYIALSIQQMAPPLVPYLIAAPLQLVVSAGTFTLMERFDDTYTKWFLLAIAGAAINYLAIPLLIQRFLPL